MHSRLSQNILHDEVEEVARYQKVRRGPSYFDGAAGIAQRYSHSLISFAEIPSLDIVA